MRPVTLVLACLLLAMSVAVTPAMSDAQEDLQMIGAIPGGQLQSRTCPDEAVMTGLRLRTGVLVDAIGIRCRRIRADGTLDREFDDGSMMGGTGGSSLVASCPAGSVVVGERFGVMSLPPYAPGTLGIHCQSWSPATRVTYGPTSLKTVVDRTGTSVTPISDFCSSPARPVRRLRVTTGTVTTGTYVLRLGLTCLST